MPEPHLRAADADRAALATVLGEHMAAGRLTVHEYEDRLGRAYAAGFAHALAGGAELVIQMDADLSHDPEHIPALIEAVA